jgi:TPR repeat protein
VTSVRKIFGQRLGLPLFYEHISVLKGRRVEDFVDSSLCAMFWKKNRNLESSFKPHVSRLDSMSGSDLYAIGRDCLFGRNFRAQECCVAFQLLFHAAKKGHSDAIWLHSVLSRHSFCRKDFEKPEASYAFLLAMFETEEETPLCLLYRGLLGDDEALWRSALENVPLAQSMFASKLENAGNLEDAFLWYDRAAAACDADGAFGLSRLYRAGARKNSEKSLYWLRKAADWGNCSAMQERARLSLLEADQLDHAKFSARVCVFGEVSFSVPCRILNDLFRRLDALDGGDVKIVIAIGRELFQYHVLRCNLLKDEHKISQRAVAIYLECLEHARRSALFVVARLRPIVSKDISRMIGQMVYSNASNIHLWWNARAKRWWKRK